MLRLRGVLAFILLSGGILTTTAFSLSQEKVQDFFTQATSGIIPMLIVIGCLLGGAQVLLTAGLRSSHTPKPRNVARDQAYPDQHPDPLI